jgi:MFS transporter, putative metabolite:H+ symporter
MGGVELARPLYFWLGTLATVAGVVLHLPMYLHGAEMHYKLAGMPMDLPMTIGMVLIVAGLVVTAYGLVPPGAFKAKPTAEVRVRALDDARMRPAHIGLIVVMSLAAPITFSLLAETIPPRHKGWVMVLIGGNLAVAFLAASWLSASLVPGYSWRVLWLVGLPTGVLLILLNRFIPESPRFLSRTAATTRPGPS